MLFVYLYRKRLIHKQHKINKNCRKKRKKSSFLFCIVGNFFLFHKRQHANIYTNTQIFDKKELSDDYIYKQFS